MPATATGTARRGTRPWGYAALSMLLGGGSVVLALLEPQDSGVANGFIASSIGITAIVLGVRAMRVSRWVAPFSRAFGRGGIVLGSVGSALMAYAVVATALFSAGIASLPALSLPVLGDDGPAIVRGMPLPVAEDGPDDVAAPSAQGDADTRADAGSGDADATDGTVDAPPADGTAADGTAADGAVGAPPADDTAAGPPEVSGLPTVVDRESEARALMVSTGTLAYRLRAQFSPGTLPETLTVGMSAPQRILLADGTPLAPVPDGTRVLYQVSPDRTQWNVTLVGGSYGAIATFSSAVGTVEAS